jgi:hypothetical protein
MINNSQFRGDNIAIIDLVPYNTGLNSVTAQQQQLILHMQQHIGLGYKQLILI